MIDTGIGADSMYLLLFISLYFEVFLLVSFLEKSAERRARPLPVPSLALPRVAIAVPCLNEERTVATTIESLLALSYPLEKLEIIVVDDGSRDSTLAIAESYARKDARVRVFSKENGGKHTAMNLALEHTTADLIGCLDADSTVERQALMRIVPTFEDRAISAVTPGIHVKKPETMLQHLQKVEYRLSIFNRYMLAALGSAFITPGPFSIFRASVVRELGGWREGHSTEDMELALRMQERGHRIANAPSATVHTATPATLRGLFRQRVRWTYGFLRNAADYRHMLGNRRYGNLGLFILPTALISVGTGIYFFLRILWYGGAQIIETIERVRLTGMLPRPSFEVYYFNTSVIWFLIYTSVVLILALICVGSRLGTGRYRPPVGTPLFILFYSFLAPAWLMTAVVRAVFRTGVRWR